MSRCAPVSGRHLSADAGTIDDAANLPFIS